MFQVSTDQWLEHSPFLSVGALLLELGRWKLLTIYWKAGIFLRLVSTVPVPSDKMRQEYFDVQSVFRFADNPMISHSPFSRSESPQDWFGMIQLGEIFNKTVVSCDCSATCPVEDKQPVVNQSSNRIQAGFWDNNFWEFYTDFFTPSQQSSGLSMLKPKLGISNSLGNCNLIWNGCSLGLHHLAGSRAGPRSPLRTEVGSRGHRDVSWAALWRQFN